ncbi:hypothetical protein ACL_0907 [Acholeplasma laidlawii PG-8A]|uniref:Uncharacterized protein n=1 Tax=Acholeplasma laidlawii (strain PG-8A) TaxID=441768 RepID=A9NGP0_ACHLI|nr:hypothetical protein ACL_0907 [Acholeplasma laidlawii PG-8A]
MKAVLGAKVFPAITDLNMSAHDNVN